MKKLLLFSAMVVFTSTSAFAQNIDHSKIAMTIHADISNQAQSIIHNKNTKSFNKSQAELSAKLEALNTLVKSKPELKNEITILKNTLTEAGVLKVLRDSLRDSLKSEPTPEELMKTYFELKATNKI